jgi:diaminopimelate epimerase
MFSARDFRPAPKTAIRSNMTEFLKMHGLGNDFIVFDARDPTNAVPDQISSAAARRLADRHFGIGCDQILVIRPSTKADVFMEILNSDGSQATACGNGTRCVADLIMPASGSSTSIETAAGMLMARREPKTGHIAVDMGPAQLGWQDVPLASKMDTLTVDLGPSAPVPAICHSIGNPHAVLFVDDADAIDLAKIGPALEMHPLFPDRANISFAHQLGTNRFRMRVWERGGGITMACGSGASAVGVAAHRAGLSGRVNDIVMDGGMVTINWQDDGTGSGRVIMQGPVAYVCRGELSYELDHCLRAV